MTVWWYIALAYLTLMALFCLAWARALPRPENSSKVIGRYEQFLALRQVLSKAFKSEPADPALKRILTDLDRAT